MGFGLWMVTRTKGLDWVVLHAEDHGYSVKSGDVFQWADSFCSRMVRGEGPRVAPRSVEIAAYAQAPIAAQVPIGAYIGVPLNNSKGELFGTLCAIDPEPQPDMLTQELPQIELMSRLLETILQYECRVNEEARRAERAEAEALTDHLTGVFNRRGWDQLLAYEEQLCRAYAHPAAILSIDLDDLKTRNDTYGHSSGDALLQHAAQVMQDNVRIQDVVARVGGDEFLILAVECADHGASKMAERVRRVLASNGISASIGYASRLANGTLRDACLAADEAMYEVKLKKKTRAVNSA